MLTPGSTVSSLDGQNAGVPVQILGFSFKSVKTVGVLQIQCCNASHCMPSFNFIFTSVFTRSDWGFFLCGAAAGTDVLKFQIVSFDGKSNLSFQLSCNVRKVNIGKAAALTANQMIVTGVFIVSVRLSLHADFADLPPADTDC